MRLWEHLVMLAEKGLVSTEGTLKFLKSNGGFNQTIHYLYHSHWHFKWSNQELYLQPPKGDEKQPPAKTLKRRDSAPGGFCVAVVVCTIPCCVVAIAHKFDGRASSLWPLHLGFIRWCVACDFAWFCSIDRHSQSTEVIRILLSHSRLVRLNWME